MRKEYTKKLIKFSRTRTVVFLLLISISVSFISFTLITKPFGFFVNKEVGDDQKYLTIIKRCDLEENRSRCWESEMEKVIKNDGLEEGFNFFKEFYIFEGSGNSFEGVGNCHSYAHILGERSYEAFLYGDKKIVESESMSYCGFGFWHGFMGQYVRKGDLDPEKITSFCSQFSQKFTDECFHGVGIGSVGDPPHPSTWGKPVDMIKGSLETCDSTATNDEQLNQCLSGVFHQQGIFALRDEYGLVFDKNEPLSLCAPYEGSHYVSPCYRQISSRLPRAFDNDLTKIYKYLEAKFNNDPIIPNLIFLSSKVLSEDQIFNDQKQQYQTFINDCKDLPKKFQEWCISGYIAGLFEEGQPDKEYIKAIDFCISEGFSTKEKKRCASSLMSISMDYYSSSEKVQDICIEINQKLKGGCNN